MTAAQFNKWIEYHFALFPELESWLRKMPPESQQNCLAANARKCTADLPAMKAASDRMHDSQFSGYPSNHFTHANQLAAQIATRSATPVAERTDEPPCTASESRESFIAAARDGNTFARTYAAKHGFAWHGDDAPDCKAPPDS